MRIGIDLDNTLVCYDCIFWQLAADRNWISSAIPARKELVRDELRRNGRESDWTSMQGEVYGKSMNDALPFPGALDAVKRFRDRGWSVFVISHRTKTPYAGPPYDLHLSARAWLKQHGFLSTSALTLRDDDVFLEIAKADKLRRIGELKLDWFIDDLPEFLIEAEFPSDVRRMLFDPHRHCPQLLNDIFVAHDWSDIPRRIEDSEDK